MSFLAEIAPTDVGDHNVTSATKDEREPVTIPAIADHLRVVSEDQAAAILLLHVQTLRKWRRTRQGPPHIAIGAKRIGYRIGDLRDWQDARRAG